MKVEFFLLLNSEEAFFFFCFFFSPLSPLFLILVRDAFIGIYQKRKEMFFQSQTGFSSMAWHRFRNVVFPDLPVPCHTLVCLYSSSVCLIPSCFCRPNDDG